jgi:hypothetical protein
MQSEKPKETLLPETAQDQQDEEIREFMRGWTPKSAPAPSSETNEEGAAELAAWQKHRQRQRGPLPTK